MRRVRWAAGSVAVVALLALTAAVFLLGTGTRDCIESATVGPQFIGTVIAKDGGAVTFRVDDVVADPVFLPDEGLGLQAGQDVIVRYGQDARFLHTGHPYLVNVYGDDVNDLRGTVGNGPCGPSSNDTVHADGRAIDTGIFTRDGFAPYVPKLLAAIGAVVVTAVLVRWRIRVKHPRLTIDGQPLAKR